MLNRRPRERRYRDRREFTTDSVVAEDWEHCRRDGTVINPGVSRIDYRHLAKVIRAKEAQGVKCVR